MNISKNLYLLFLLSILVPGVVLAYLSFRTMKDETILIEKSLEDRNEDFAEAVQSLLDKTRGEYLNRLQDQLRRTNSAGSPDERLFLATELLSNPLIQSLVIFQRDELVFPRRLAQADSAPAGDRRERARRRVAFLVRGIQGEYRRGHLPQCLRLIRAFREANPDSTLTGELGTPYRYGLGLLELKCLVGLRQGAEAVQRGRELIHALLQGDGFSSYHQAAFYLVETVDLLNSLEDLGRETRDYFWSIHQRAETFLVNAEFVRREWNPTPEYLLRGHNEDVQRPIQVEYYDGYPYLVIGYPWLDKETQVVARLNESVFAEAVEAEIVQARKSPWKDMDFALANARGQAVAAAGAGADSAAARPVALERALNLEFPAWRIKVFRKREGEIAALSRRKLALLYTLLGLALTALLLGSFSVLVNLRHERKMVRMKANFLSAVSHELKTPLTSIRMFAEILESGRQTQEEKRQRYAHLIGEEAMRLHGLIEGILNFTRLEERKAQWNMVDLDLGAVVREVADLMAEAYGKAGIRLRLDLPAQAVVKGDFEALRSVVQNLLENAMKYSAAGTEVAVAVEDEPGRAVLRVRDRGIGISPGDQKRIFDKFYRAGDEMTRKAKGSGLGLAIVKQILDVHRATIRVDSKLGEGTEMTVIFPKAGQRVPAGPAA